MLDGVPTLAPQGSVGGQFYDYTSLEEAQVQTVANDAEMPTNGIMLNAIIKSGGNQFHGTTWLSQTWPSLQSNNIDDRLRAIGINSGVGVVTRWDRSADIGGRIIPDKLWFYANARTAKSVDESINAIKPDGSQGDTTNGQQFATGKISYQATQSHRFNGFYQWNWKDLYSDGNEFLPYESTFVQDQIGGTSKVEWTGLFGDSVVASLHYGYWYFDAVIDGRGSGKVGTYDISTLKYTGDHIQSYRVPVDYWNWRHHTRGHISVFKKDLAWGDHDFKAGYDFTPGTLSVRTGVRASGDYSLQFANGAPFRLITYNAPTTPLNVIQYTGAYVRDSWSVSPRLTLNMGIRFDRQTAFAPEQSRVEGTFAAARSFSRIELPAWNNLAPRLHAAFDVSGDARTVIKGGWGRFNQQRTAGEVQVFNSNNEQATTWEWRDLNGNRDYDPGEVNLDPNDGRDFVSATGGITRVINPDEEQPQLDEWSVTIERELFPNFGVRASGLYVRGSNNRQLLNTLRPPEVYTIPVPNRDPGPDGARGRATIPATSSRTSTIRSRCADRTSSATWS